MFTYTLLYVFFNCIQLLIKQRKYLHMKTIDNQILKSNYTALFCHNVQSLVFRRNNLRISQQHMAYKSRVSLRTIQNFENYKSENAYLIYAYKQILK